MYFILSSFITLPLHQDIFLSYPRYKEHVFQQSLLLLHSLQFSLQLLSPQDNNAINPSISTVRRFSALYSVVFLMMHIPPFLRILLHHLPDSGYVRCQYIYFLFGLLTMIFHSVRRVGFHLYMAVSTLQLTSIRNLSEYWQLLLKHTSRCRSIFGFHILLSDTAVESCVTFKPRKAPIQLIQFSRFNNQKFLGIHFCTYFD